MEMREAPTGETVSSPLARKIKACANCTMPRRTTLTRFVVVKDVSFIKKGIPITKLIAKDNTVEDSKSELGIFLVRKTIAYKKPDIRAMMFPTIPWKEILSKKKNKIPANARNAVNTEIRSGFFFQNTQSRRIM